VAPAHAAERVAGDVALEAGPVVAGAQVLWAERSADGSVAVRSGGGATVFRFAPPGRADTSLRLTALAASGGYVAFAHSVSVVAGRLRGPFFRVAGSRRPATPGGCRAGAHPNDLALSGARLVVLELIVSCTRAGVKVRDRLVLIDLRRPAAHPRVLAQGSRQDPGLEPRRALDAPRIGGRYVAWLQSDVPDARTTAVLADLRGRRLAAVTAPVPGADDVLDWFALQSDGSMALSFHREDGNHGLAWRPRRGDPVVLPGRLGDAVSVGFAGGRVAYVRGDGLVLAGRTGPVRHLAPGPLLAGPVWNGRVAAWATGARDAATIWSAHG